MAEQLKISIVQADLAWENSEKNLERFDQHLQDLPEGVDVVVLPEMFTTGFTMNPENVAQEMDGEAVQWLQDKAMQHNSVFTGSLVIKDGDDFVNRLIWVTPSGELSYYDKRHTFTLAGEDKVYRAGKEKTIIHYKGWRFCPQICYDLRFPVWARNVEDYDVLFFVANWPKPRINAWDALLKARAIENMSYCIGVNRVGVDHSGHSYPGHSAVYDGLGESIAVTTENKEEVATVVLEKTHLETIRKKLRFLDDRDTFSLRE